MCLVYSRDLKESKPTKFRFYNKSLTSAAMTKLLEKIGSKITSLTLDYSKSEKEKKVDEAMCISDSSSHADSWSAIDSDCCTDCTCSDDSLTSEMSSEPEDNSDQIMNSDLFEKLLCEQCTNLEVLHLRNLPSAMKGKVALANGKPLNIKDISIYNEYCTPTYKLVFLKNIF